MVLLSGLINGTPFKLSPSGCFFVLLRALDQARINVA